jgi:2-polyprenyl-3-methyl-5-hydroxy-6-metoxy-1,4-benzoquinol methylase
MNGNPTKPPGYDTKPASYFEQSRPEMLPFVPSDCKRVLDVGCGRGNFGQALKQERKIEVWGLEPVAAAAAEAATKLDRVIEGIFTPDANLPPANFDVITFNDVLEHLLDPAEALQFAGKLLKPSGAIVASIPNFRHFPAMWDIVVRGEWRYRDSGIFDRTHLRFFTRKSILALFADCNFSVEKIEGLNAYWGDGTDSSPRWRNFKIINGLTLNAIEDMKYLQFAVVARPVKAAH